jgi:hypothetical protein
MRLVRRARRPSAGERGFMPYHGPEAVGGYRRKCAFASQGQGGTMHTIAAE